jgi:predicted alpha/beta-hydrolase family hydrolase
MDDFKHMPRLAKQLGVDGVLMVYLTPGYYSHGTGVDFRGRRSGIYKPVVETFVDAYSAAGKRVVRYNLRYSPADKQAVRQDHSHYIKLNEAIASKHAYMAGIDAAKRIWGIK